MLEIKKIATKLNITDYDLYGKYKCKINNIMSHKKGKIILVTAISPTKYGEGKTTMSIGLHDALSQTSNSILCLREPSLGPVFGLKGGACGGGKAQIVPNAEINLHFTGDMHAITAANNLLCAAIDNHIFQGNQLEIKKVLFERCLDVNDRSLRNITLNNGEKTSFNITAASEIMAILCLSKDLADLRKNLENIIIGINANNKFVYASQLNIVGSMLALLKDAFKPNLVQTLEGNPVIVHGGPFANIAHGCNSIIATSYGQSLADYVITEAGFGSDCGALKYFDIVCRKTNLLPTAIVLVVTLKALEVNGLENLYAHLTILKRLNPNIVVCLNKFQNDDINKINELATFCKEHAVLFSISTAYSDGGSGSLDLAEKVKLLCTKNNTYNLLYDVNLPIKDKINKIVKDIYLAKDVIYSAESKAFLELLQLNNLTNLPICIAKTPLSISDDKNKLGYPKDFTVTVTNIKISNGAGFIVIYLGNILTMPGLNKKPDYENIDVVDNNIIGIT